jgi:hypothetical protein
MPNKRQGTTQNEQNERPARDFKSLGIVDQASLDRFLGRYGKKFHLVPDLKTDLARHAATLGLKFQS